MQKVCKYCSEQFLPKYHKQMFCTVTCSNRKHLNNKHLPLHVPENPNDELAELFGVLLGDGGVEKYFVKIYSNMIADKGYSQRLILKIRRLFPDVKISHYLRPMRGTEEIQISSKELCDYLRSIGFDSKNRSIPEWITINEKFAIATIRGLFDTEGSVGVKYYQGRLGLKVYKQLTFTNKNKNILNFTERYLGLLGFHPTKKSEKNIYISNKDDIERYMNIIGTSNPKLEKKLKSTRITKQS